MGSATGTVGGLGQRRFESQDQSAPTSTTTWQQEALRVRASCEWGRGAQGKDSLHDPPYLGIGRNQTFRVQFAEGDMRSEEHTSELQSQSNLVCRLLLEQ